MSKLGWCLTGKHEGHNGESRACPGRIQKFIHIPAKRNKVASIEMIDEWTICNCSCHSPEKPKKRIKK